jgi:hypothetical protein
VYSKKSLKCVTCQRSVEYGQRTEWGAGSEKAEDKENVILSLRPRGFMLRPQAVAVASEGSGGFHSLLGRYVLIKKYAGPSPAVASLALGSGGSG